MKHLVFVYGSLKQGMMRHKSLANQKYIGVATTEPLYAMFQLSGYPAMIDKTHPEGEKLLAQAGREIYGELYEVDMDCLNELDKIEGVSSNLYERKTVHLKDVYPVALPTTQDLFAQFHSKMAESYFYKKQIGGARECGMFWSHR
jgi:gamma-glutamylcyclotransferase (GGCT)/AIG2-like uncharacterized protein YtfP